jgi:hypothetical protein
LTGIILTSDRQDDRLEAHLVLTEDDEPGVRISTIEEVMPLRPGPDLIKIQQYAAFAARDFFSAAAAQ